ncbi:hypothetical protein ABT112_21640 [Streptomyces sp. NPDC002055]
MRDSSTALRGLTRPHSGHWADWDCQEGGVFSDYKLWLQTR